MRSPASGRRSSRIFYPDVIAAKNGRILLFEVKLRKHIDTIHIPKYKVEKLRQLEHITGGKAYIVVRVVEDKRWYCFTLDMIEKQVVDGKERYAITKRQYDKALTLKQIITQNNETQREKQP